MPQAKPLQEPSAGPHAALNNVGKALEQALTTLYETLPALLDALEDASCSLRIIALVAKARAQADGELTPEILAQIDEIESGEDEQEEDGDDGESVKTPQA